MSFFGAELNTQVNKLIFEIRLNLARNKYTPNLRTIYRSCANYDRELTGLIGTINFEHVCPSLILGSQCQWNLSQEVRFPALHQGL